MAHQQKGGAISAVLMATSFVVGIAVSGTVLLPAGYLDADTDPVQKVAVLTLSYLVAFVPFGSLLVVLALALHERLKAGAAGRTRTPTVFGMI